MIASHAHFPGARHQSYGHSSWRPNFVPQSNAKS